MASDSSLLFPAVAKLALDQCETLAAEQFQGLGAAAASLGKSLPASKEKNALTKMAKELNSAVNLERHFTRLGSAAWMAKFSKCVEEIAKTQSTCLPPPPPPPPLVGGCNVCGKYICLHDNHCTSWCMASDYGEYGVATLVDTQTEDDGNILRHSIASVEGGSRCDECSLYECDFLLDDQCQLMGVDTHNLETWHSIFYNESDCSYTPSFGQDTLLVDEQWHTVLYCGTDTAMADVTISGSGAPVSIDAGSEVEQSSIQA